MTQDDQRCMPHPGQLRTPVHTLRVLVEGGKGIAWAEMDRETKTAFSNAGLLDGEMTMDGNMHDLNATAREFMRLDFDIKKQAKGQGVINSTENI